MNYTTLTKNALWVAGGMFVGKIVQDRIISPNIQSLELNPTLKALLGPAVLAGGVYLVQGMVPKKVAYGALGVAGSTVIQSTVGMPMLGGEQEQNAEQA